MPNFSFHHKRFYKATLQRCSGLLLFAFNCIYSHAQETEVTTKLTGIKKTEEFRLYNEPGTEDPAKFTTEIKIGFYPKNKWNWSRRNSSNENQLSYVSDYGFDYHANDPFEKRFLNADIEKKIVEGLFGYKSISRSYVNGIPEHYFDADGDGYGDLLFTYYSWRDPNRLWETNGRRYDIYVDQPVLLFYRKNLQSIRNAFTIEKVCYNAVPRSRTWLKADLRNQPRFRSVHINNKDYTTAYNNRQLLDTLLPDNPSSVKLSLVRPDGYNITFEMPVNNEGALAACPVFIENKNEIAYSIKKQNGVYPKRIRIDMALTGIHDKNAVTQLSPGDVKLVTKTDYSLNLNATLIGDSTFLYSPFRFFDGWNNIEVKPGMLASAQAKFKQAPDLNETSPVFTVRGAEMINANTILLLLDSLGKNGSKKISIEPVKWFNVESIWMGDKQLENGALDITEDMNGRKLDISLKDMAGERQSFPLTILIKDGPSQKPLPLTLISDESNYKKYFKTIRIEEPKGKFVWVKEKKRHFLDNTTIDLTRPFRLQYKMNEASRIPDIIFGVNPNTDFLRVRFAGDSAILQEEHADGTILPKGFAYPITRRNDRTIVLERRDNYLAEGIPGRRDYLLINDKAFIYFKTTELASAYNAKIGFDMSAAGSDFKFTDVALSEHTYREVAGPVASKPLTLHSGLTRYLLNTEPDDNINYEEDLDKQKDLFKQLQENSYALIISNYDYKIKVNDFPGNIVSGVRDSIVNELQSFQFKKENIITLNNLTYDSLRKVFTYLFGGGSMSMPASLENIRKIFPAFNTDGRAKANIYFHYIGHATEYGLAPVDIVDKTDAFPINDWLRKVNTGEAVAIKNFLYVQDACHNSIQDLQPLPYSYSLADHLFQYDASTTGREAILASKESTTSNFNLSRGMIKVLGDFSFESGPFSIRELFRQLKSAGHADAINFELNKLPRSQEKTGSFIFYPKYLINED